ncbi:hypothetical protein BO78DRAFT_438702 [Aspergillus sclerotiicarbonarius CBS 121057]|uniref:Uncharacterized protein n=1 Tax=Aspergillus sclerotiicarbonarius (strain CBS 121057 / IBT 28362) TaxID=1448318 RepID=A0A319DS25_ASPSB|nr:hypothetical protein BO78DRAFT_438702 [Aspergillus sclerotiicarbonarius CBS 121057]
MIILSVIVLILTYSTFIPQIHHVQKSKTSQGISSIYLLSNLLCTTEHLFFITSNMIYLHAISDLPIDNPIPRISITLTLLDWLNFAQVLGIWVLSNIFVILCPAFHPRRRLRIFLIIFIYIFFLIFTLIPLFLDTVADGFCPPAHPHHCALVERDIIPLLMEFHVLFVLPVVTLLFPVVGFVMQIYRQRQRQQQQQGVLLHQRQPDLNALLARSRIFQAVVFGISAVGWVFRVDGWWVLWRGLGEGEGSVPVPVPWVWGVVDWWVGAGYVVVDDAVFGIGQGVLGLVDLRGLRGRQNGDENGGEEEGEEEGERRPLLVASS